MSDQDNIVIVLTTGKQDRGARATLAFSWACTALAMGKAVSLFLAMDGTVWALQGMTKGVQVEGFEPLSRYLDQFLTLGGELMVCAPCSKHYCGLDQGQVTRELCSDVRQVGVTTVIARTGPGSSFLTF